MASTDTPPILTQDSQDEEDETPLSCNHCTFAVTGNQVSFQAIFVCNECFNENADEEHVPLCICQACADICHGSDDHDVEYIGMGPSYCDCDHVGNCTIFEKSRLEAERLGMRQPVIAPDSEPTETIQNALDRTPFFYDVFDIPALKNPEVSGSLVQHAQELVQHSKDTFWLSNDTNSESLCPLERLAWSIYQQHLNHYNLRGDPRGGAEWWVQVKETTGENTAIDLHYDKDEALAESFALGSFPTLSTVTYLTFSKAAPTIVMDHKYSQGEEDIIDTMLLSRPRLGKHLIFDGTLLHGAPAHELLKPSSSADKEEIPSSSSSSIRVTFLVNVWSNSKPANIHTLPHEIREKLLTLPNIINTVTLQAPFEQQQVPSISLQTEDDLPEKLRQRMELPFVTKGITWEEQINSVSENDEEDGGGLVVMSFPPPPTQHDTLLLTFGPGLQAYLDYSGKDPDDEPVTAELPPEKQPARNENGYV